MLDKYSAIDPDLAALLGLDEEEEYRAKVQQQLAQIPQVPTQLSARERVQQRVQQRQPEPEPVSDPAPHVPYFPPGAESIEIPEAPDFSMFESVEQIPAPPEGFQTEIPDWIKQDIPSGLSEEEPEGWAPPQLDLIELFPEAKPTAQVSKPADPVQLDPFESEPESEPAPATESAEPESAEPTNDVINDAIDLILRFEERQPDVFAESSDAIRDAERLVAADETDEKTIADTLGYTIGALQKLRSNYEGQGQDLIYNAAKLLEEYYGEEARDRIHQKKFDKRLNEQVIKQVVGPKPRPLARLTSEWHSENTRYERNRAIDLMMADQTLGETQAAERARDEWNRITEVVDELNSDKAPEQKEEEKTRFAQLVMGGEGIASFEKAEQQYREAIRMGISAEEGKAFYQDAQLLEDSLSTAQNLSGSEYVTEGIEDMPQEYVEVLEPLIVRFGKVAEELIKLGEFWSPQWEDSQGLISSPNFTNVQYRAQELNNKAVNLSTQISSVPTSIKQQAFENGAIFKEVHSLMREIGSYYEMFEIEPVGETLKEMSPEEKMRAGMGLSGKPEGGGTKPKEHDESEWTGLAKKKRVRNPVVEERARQNYLNFLRYSGRIQDYYAKRKSYYHNVLKRQNPDIEKRRLRRDVRQLKIEPQKWKEAAFTIGQPEKRNKLIQDAIDQHKKNSRMFWEKVNESWLSQEEIDKITQERFDDRINKLQEALEYLTGMPRQAHPDAVEALREHIGNVRKYWNEAQQLAEKRTDEERFKPGERTEEDRARRLGVSEQELLERQNKNRRKHKGERARPTRGRIIHQASELANLFMKIAISKELSRAS